MSVLDAFVLTNVPREWPVRTCEAVADYDGNEMLAIACTQMSDDKLQRRLVKEWCAFLPTATTVHRLAFRSHTNQALFNAACHVPSLRWLAVKWGSIKDLEPLSNQSRLEYLDFSSCPRATPASAIGTLTNLTFLRLNNVRDAKKIEWIARLKSLRELDIGGSMWTAQTIDSLEPISQLHALELLICAEKVLDRRSIRSLSRLKCLRGLWLPQSWPSRIDIEYLISEIPGLQVIGWPWD